MEAEQAEKLKKVQEEYNLCALRLGDNYYQVKSLEALNLQILQKMSDLNRKADDIKGLIPTHGGN